MKLLEKYPKLTAISVLLALFMLLSATEIRSDKNARLRSSSAAADSCQCYSTSSLYNIYVYFNNVVPGDLQSFNQSKANCFAWQEFIALNWPSNPNSGFGTPKDMQPVQWETYMPSNVLFQPNGAPPPNWGTLVSQEYAKKFKSQRLVFQKSQTKLLTFTSKFDDTDTIAGMDFQQAAPFGQPNWLGAQNSTNLWYEIVLNKDYYDFLVQTGYYNAVTQHDSAKAGIPLNFPEGVYKGKVGAIELKAAWMEVPNPQSAQWRRYKLSNATVLDPQTNQLRNTVVALVGLHILHKTKNQPTWVWATFEQIDNVPNANTKYPSPPYGYNYYNKNCQAKNVEITTGHGDSTVTVSCTTNVSPPYYLKQAKPVPIQITRVNGIDSVDAIPVNTRMQAAIRQFDSSSVWQYYQLVDVIWSQSLQKNPTKPIQAPRKINRAAMLSGAAIVANTGLESYVQKTNTCFSCHVYSTIAPYPLDTANNDVFGDFSFAIGFAQYPKLRNLKGKKLK